MPALKQPKLPHRTLARYDFDDGSAVEIACFGNVETAVAIKVISTLLSLKSEELGKGRAPVALAKTG